MWKGPESSHLIQELCCADSTGHSPVGMGDRICVPVETDVSIRDL